MRDKTLGQVPAACDELYQKGLAALEAGDADSAISSFMQALEIEPGFVDCREALRRAQCKAAEKKPGLWKRLFRKDRFSPTLSEAEVMLHVKPLKTISLAEHVLNRDPGNIKAHKLLAKAALVADMPRTALLSLEPLADEDPEHRAIKQELAQALAKSGDTSAAAAIYGQLLKAYPGDGAVLRALRELSGQPVAQQEPETANGHTLDKVAEAASARPLQTPSAPAAASSSDEVINRFEPLLAHCPRNTKVLQTLAEAYARKLMFDQSISFYKRALEIAGGKNAALEKAIAETTLKKFDVELSRLDPKAPESAALREHIQNQRLEFQWHAMEESA
jgi:tetratricopeptide (TPR) repeat protein